MLEGGKRNASTRVADKVGWPVNWWPTLDHGGVHHNKLLGLHELSKGYLRGNSRPLGFPTPREAWISSPWLPHLGTAFRRFQAEAPK
jgi:hypothetical protein